MSGIPSNSSVPTNHGPPAKSGGNGAIIAIVVAVLAVFSISAICVVGILALLLRPAVSSARDAARRNVSANNAKNIALAILNYQSAHGKLPPQFTVNEQGRPLHSWRTLILPFMEEDLLYGSIDLDSPWNEGDNLSASDVGLSCYHSPCYDDELLMTNYVAIAGEGFLFNGNQELHMGEINDGPANTVLLVEIANSDIAWAKPRDLTLDQLKLEAAGASPDATNVVRDVAIVGYVDGHVVATMIDDLQEFQKQLTHSGGELVESW